MTKMSYWQTFYLEKKTWITDQFLKARQQKLSCPDFKSKCIARSPHRLHMGLKWGDTHTARNIWNWSYCPTNRFDVEKDQGTLRCFFLRCWRNKTCDLQQLRSNYGHLGGKKSAIFSKAAEYSHIFTSPSRPSPHVAWLVCGRCPRAMLRFKSGRLMFTCHEESK